MPRENELRAKFEGWKLRDGRSVKAQFEIIIRLRAATGYSYRYNAFLVPTMQKLSGSDGKNSWAESNLEMCKQEIAKQFEKQLTDWA
jgi:hypothetical protein